MSTNLFKLHEFLTDISSEHQGNQTAFLEPIDYIFYGLCLSKLAISQSPTDFLKKILYISDLYKNGLFSLKQKLTLYQEITAKPLERMDHLIDSALDHAYGNNINKNPPEIEKIESFEEKKLSEDYIQRMLEEENRRHKEDLQLSEALAQRLLEEDKKTQELHRKLQEQEQENVDCEICLTPLFSGGAHDVWGLINCQHCFHKSCLHPYLEGEISNKKFPIKCPMENCPKEILNEDLMENMEQTSIDKYLDFTLKNYVDIHAAEMSWCPTADCNFAFVYDNEIRVLNCPRCRNSYCLKCRTVEHKDMTCKEYQINSKTDKNDEKFIDFVKGHKFKQCTQCLFWVEKNQGCDHMTCRCGYQFCYKCGGKYQACECMNPQPVPVRNIVPAKPAGRGFAKFNKKSKH